MAKKRPAVHEYYVCCSQYEFEHEVKGNKTNYIITHGTTHTSRNSILDFACSCPAYQYRKTKGKVYCKHILSTIDENKYCGWDQYEDGGEPVNNRCPKCNGPVRKVLYAIE